MKGLIYHGSKCSSLGLKQQTLVTSRKASRALSSSLGWNGGVEGDELGLIRKRRIACVRA